MLVQIYDNRQDESGNIVDICYIGEKVSTEECDAYMAAADYIKNLLLKDDGNYSLMVQYHKEIKNEICITIPTPPVIRRFEFKFDRLGIEEWQTISGEVYLEEDNNILSFKKFNKEEKKPPKPYTPIEVVPLGGQFGIKDYRSTGNPLPATTYYSSQTVGNDDSVIGSTTSGEDKTGMPVYSINKTLVK